MLLAAGCCIPAILSMIATWAKIVETKWQSQRGQSVATNPGATEGAQTSHKKFSETVEFFLKWIEIPFFAGIVLAIVVVGEENFWSTQVYYQTEPMAAVG